ncbi:MAG: tetratricopeptide repeat protein, partial [Gemmatimonadetes bacterium]|nr:tetratricopeptide repeat protein [Gemmatimonadota bacterium]
SLVVLPFQNVGADPENEYFSDGLTEELINVLAHLPGLHVAARTSSFAFKGQQVPADSIARRLNVAHVLDGSVRTSERRLRITAQLVHAEDGTVLWSESYDRERADVFAVQEEISQAIAEALEIRLGAGSTPTASMATPDLEAYDLYLRGRFLWKRSGAADVAQSIVLFQQALEKDPGYAAAWVGLADAYTVQANWAYAAPQEVFPKAKEAVLRALKLAPEMAEAHTTLGHVLRWWDHDRPAARRAFETALRLRPDYPEAHQWYAWFVVDEGRFDEALGHMRRAQELDPMSAVISGQVGSMLYLAGRYEEAAAQARRTLEMDSTEVQSLYNLALAEWRLGERAEPIALLARADQLHRSTW